MMKGKLSLTIIIGFTAFVFTMVMFTQFKTVEQTDITAIETMRETELREELARTKANLDDVESKLTETENKIEEYKKQTESEEDTTKILEDELKEAKMYLGYTDVVGPGIVITLSDNTRSIESYDLINVVNELKLAGAEAISINDNRVVSTTEIVDIVSRYIMINGKQRISSPYIIKAIGEQKYLESGITLKNGYIDEIKANGKNISYVLQNEVIINAYDGNIEMQYSSVVE